MKEKVLIVSTVVATIGQFNRANIEILQNMNYEVHIATDYEDISVWPKEKISDFKNEMKELNVTCFQINFSRSAFKINKHISAYVDLLGLVRENHYKFIHVHTPIASVITRLVTKKTKTKLIYTAHGFHFYKGAPIKNWILYYPIEKWLSRYTNVLITINKEDYIRAKKKFKAQKLVYVPGVGVDTSLFEPSENYELDKKIRKEKRIEIGIPLDAILMVSVGELNENKNHSVIVRALKGCSQNIHYAIAGKGDLDKKLQDLAVENGVRNQVHLLGFRTDIPDIYRAADICIFPSIREGLGLAAVEGMAAGLPLIVSNNRGLRDVINSENGITCEYNDVRAFKDAINKMTSMIPKGECSVMKKNNISKSKNFDRKVVNEKMMKIYREM